MTAGIVWLASYPKSGNTWFRLLLANLRAKTAEPADINALPHSDGIASGRGEFDSLTLLESGLLTHEEADRLRPGVYRALAREGDETRFIKVHDAYLPTSTGEPLLGGSAAARGAIYILRDPRDVAPSLAHHLGRSIDEAIAFMADPDAGFAQSRNRQHTQLRQRLQQWSGHVASWLDQRDLPVHLVRYEDLHDRPVEIFTAALAFAGVAASREEIATAVRHSDFTELQRQEQAKGFSEKSKRSAMFFRKGRTGGWRDSLTAAQAARIEAVHGTMMQRLGYPSSEAPPLAATSPTEASRRA